MLALVADDMVYDANTMPEAIKGKDKAKIRPGSPRRSPTSR